MAHIKVVVNCSYSTSPSVTPRYQGGWFNHSLVRLPFFSWIPKSLNTTKYKWMKSANDASLPRGIKFFKVLCWLNFKLAQLFRAFPKAPFIMPSCWAEAHCKRNIYYCPHVCLPSWSRNTCNISLKRRNSRFIYKMVLCFFFLYGKKYKYASLPKMYLLSSKILHNINRNLETILFKLVFHLLPITAVLISSEIQSLLELGDRKSLILPKPCWSLGCTVDSFLLCPCVQQTCLSGHFPD